MQNAGRASETILLSPRLAYTRIGIGGYLGAAARVLPDIAFALVAYQPPSIHLGPLLQLPRFTVARFHCQDGQVTPETKVPNHHPTPIRRYEDSFGKNRARNEVTSYFYLFPDERSTHPDVVQFIGV
jgi:hypothetical protein